ncbi:hypothetical protein BN128_3964 [Cronobacter sakazakii 696]|nr:hypothetical protein BN128_3964 [Cronobacter sakazakii 696]
MAWRHPFLSAKPKEWMYRKRFLSGHTSRLSQPSLINRVKQPH